MRVERGLRKLAGSIDDRFGAADFRYVDLAYGSGAPGAPGTDGEMAAPPRPDGKDDQHVS